MKKRLYQVVILFLCIFQSEKAFPQQVIPPSPKTSEFIKYTDYPVNFHTGLPVIDVPIYTINHAGITIPISLSYHASGFKPNERFSSIGQGWTLNADFRISRIINSAPDEKCISILTKEENSLPGETIYQRETNEAKQYLLPIADNRYKSDDSEFDIFYYSYPSGSGKYIYERNASYKFIAHPLPYKPIKINTETNYADITSRDDVYIKNIEITDENGNIYRYSSSGEREDVVIYNYPSNSTSKDSGTTAWLLTDIKIAKTGEIISFSYSSPITRIEFAKDFSKNIYFHMDAQITNANSNYLVTTSKTTSTERKITAIRTAKEEVLFNYNADMSHLKDIQIKSNDGTLIKNISLTQSLYSASSPYWYKLDNVVFKDKYEKEINRYSFSYNEGTMPLMYKTDSGIEFSYSAYSIDHWGFYNGTSNTNLLSKETNSTALPFHLKILVGDADRKPNATYAKTGVLKQVVYPTGGIKTFEYESNTTGYGIVVGGLRVKRIMLYDGLKTEQRIFEHKEGIATVGNPYTESDDAKKFAPFRNAHFTSTKYNGQDRWAATYTVNPSPQTNYNLNGNPVIYGMVTERIVDINNKTLGSIDHFFDTSSAMLPERDIVYDEFPSSFEKQYIPFFSITTFFPDYLKFVSYVCFQKYHRFGNILENKTIVYGADNKPVKISERKYTHSKRNNFKGLLAKRKYTAPEDWQITGCDFWKRNYYVEQLLEHLDEEIVTEYLGGRTLTTRKTYAYDSYNALIQEKEYNSETDYIEKTYKYPYSASIAPYTEMVANNMIATVIETKNTSNGKVVSVEKNNYIKSLAITNNLILPSSVEVDYRGTNNSRKVMTFDLYDANGKPLQVTGKDGIQIIYVWSYSGQYPVAEIKDATYSEVESAVKSAFSVAGISEFSKQKTPSETKLKDGALQSALPNAIVTTYTYKPLIGIQTITEPNKTTTTYEYDTFGNLKRIKDTEKNIVGEYMYHYKK